MRLGKVERKREWAEEAAKTLRESFHSDCHPVRLYPSERLRLRRLSARSFLHHGLHGTTLAPRGGSLLRLLQCEDVMWEVAKYVVPREEVVRIFVEALMGRWEMGVETGLKLKVDVNGEWGENRWPVLFWALREGNEKAVRLLLRRGADVRRRLETYRGNGRTALGAGMFGASLECMRLVREAGSAEGSATKSLQMAAGGGDVALVREMLEKGGEVGTRTRGWTALHYAAAGGSESCMKILMEAGARWASPGWKQELEVAVLYGSAASTRALLEAGADVSHVYERGNTALTLAANRGSEECVRLLLEAGSDVGHVSRCGNTAFTLAANKGSEECVRLLLEAGSDVGHVNEFGNTALILAAKCGSVTCARMLVEAGSDIDHVGNLGLTACERAVREGHPEVAAWLALVSSAMQ